MLSDDEARALAEVAKTTGKTVDALREAGPFLNEVFGSFVTDAVGVLADRLRFYRIERFFELRDRTLRRLAARGHDISHRTVPPNFALPLIENATLEEDPTLQELWAALLANAMDASQPEPRKAFVDIVTSLEPLDARVLNFLIHNEGWGADEWLSPELVGWTVAGLVEELRVNEHDIRVSLGNLFRLGCIMSAKGQTLDEMDEIIGGLHTDIAAVYQPTWLGQALVVACSDPKTGSEETSSQ